MTIGLACAIEDATQHHFPKVLNDDDAIIAAITVQLK